MNVSSCPIFPKKITKNPGVGITEMSQQQRDRKNTIERKKASFAYWHVNFFADGKVRHGS